MHSTNTISLCGHLYCMLMYCTHVLYSFNIYTIGSRVFLGPSHASVPAYTAFPLRLTGALLRGLVEYMHTVCML